jgi:hypothetical protein
MYLYNTGDTVRYQPADIRQRSWLGTIIGRGEQAGEPVYDLVTDTRRCWAEEWQLTMVESHAGKVERQIREMLAVLS